MLTTELDEFERGLANYTQRLQLQTTLVSRVVTTLRFGMPSSPFAALDEAARSVPCSSTCLGRSASLSAACATCDACARCSMVRLRPRELARLRIPKQTSRSLLRCPAATAGNASDARKVEPVRFVHFPKCGTSFTYTLVAHRCAHVMSVDDLHAQLRIDQGGFQARQVEQRLISAARAAGEPGLTSTPRTVCGGRLTLPIFGHMPVRPGGAATLVGMFRRPAQRLISAFLHGKHAVGSGLWQRGQRDAQYDALNLSAWARHPGIAGCMTKMLTGHQCADGVAVTAQLVRDALRTLRGRFRFVGIVERWELSVCLYHRILGHRPVGAEFFRTNGARDSSRAGGAIDSDVVAAEAEAEAAAAPQRRRRRRLRGGGWSGRGGSGGSGGRGSRGGVASRRLYDEAALEGWVDAADEGVYQEALAMFHEQLAEVAQPALMGS